MAERRRTQGDLMTPAQVAEYLQLHKLTIYKYIREGRLPAARIGRSLRVLKTDVDELLEAQKVAPKRAARPHVAARQIPRPDGPSPSERQTSPPAESGRKSERMDPRGRGEEGRLRDAMVSSNPLEWVIRGLH